MRKIKKQKREELVEQYLNKDGYLVVDLEDGNGRVEKGIRTDKMVFETFVRKLRADEELEHIDGNKLNNCVNNLRAIRKK